LSLAETLLLGAMAGFTIYLGMPVGRVSHVDQRVRVALAMFSVGILAFIFLDVGNHAEQIVASSLQRYKDGTASLPHVLGLFALLAVAFTCGTAGIAAIGRLLPGRSAAPPIAGGSGALTAEELAEHELAARRRALHTGMTIAAAIGLHNFAEGLAIGVSARAGAIGLATVLIIGFALHNTSEGFGIVGPLGGVKPSWRWLGVAGLVGGGPTFFGTIVGYQFHSDPLELCFYALAGGAILYVVGEIWTATRRYGYRTLGLYLLAAGFLTGVATDLIVTYAGG
jgi:ZIP family zinc transporter